MRLDELYNTKKDKDSVVIKYDGTNYRVPDKDDDEDDDKNAYYTADREDAEKEAKKKYGDSIVSKVKIGDGEITEGIEL